MITYDEAIKITKEFAIEVRNVFQDNLTAVFVIGSLGSDYYRPGQSDIDTVIISKLSREELGKYRRLIRVLADNYQDKYNVPKGFGAILLSEEQLYPPYISEEELILEIYRIKLQSRLIYGNYDISLIPNPPKEAIIEDARSFERWRTKELINNTLFKINNNTVLVNSTLMMLKRYLMIKCDIIEFNKFKVIDLYIKNNPPYVDAELFDFISAALYEEQLKIDETTFERFVKSHDELTRIINNICL